MRDKREKRVKIGKVSFEFRSDVILQNGWFYSRVNHASSIKFHDCLNERGGNEHVRVESLQVYGTRV